MPLNDDWTYALAVRSILDTGRFSLIPWSAANAFVQAYWGALFCLPFGFSFEALRASTLVLAEVGLLAGFLLLRELGASRVVAAVGALTMGCSPLYLSLSASFMTDVPFTALVLLSLWLYVRGAARDRNGPILLAYAVALLAVLNRQFAVVLPVAFGVAELVRRPGPGRAVLWLAAVLLPVGVHLGFQRWMVTTGRTSGFELPVRDLLSIDRRAALAAVVKSLLFATPLLGVLVLPFAVLAPVAPERGAGWRGWTLAASVLALAELCFAALTYLGVDRPIIGNVIELWGVGPLTLRDSFFLDLHLPFVPGQQEFWRVMMVAGCWSAALLGVAGLRGTLALLRTGGRADAAWRPALLLTFIGAYGAAALAAGALATFFDRYLLPLIVPLCALLSVTGLAGVGRWRTPLAAALVAAMAALSVPATHDWLAWNRTRLRAAEFLAEHHVPPQQVDGGYEYNGLTTYRPDYEKSDRKSWWWVEDDAWVIASGPMDGYDLVASFPFSAWLWRGNDRIVVLRRR